MSETPEKQSVKREYVAVQNGTLSSPFRYVRKGERVHISSVEPLKSKWLVLAEGHVERKGDLPIMSNLKVRQVRDPAPSKPQFQSTQDKDYIRNMADIKRKEALEDAAKQAAHPTPPAKPGGEGEEAKGSGAQEVI